MTERTHYQILQVDPSAEPEVIEAAFKRLARKYHPDHNPAPEAVGQMQAINAAYAVLRDARRRAQYDQALGGASSGSMSRAAGQSSLQRAAAASQHPLLHIWREEYPLVKLVAGYAVAAGAPQLDFAVPAYKAGLIVDGLERYGADPAAFRAYTLAQQQLQQAGWQLLQVTSAELRRDPAGVAAALYQLVADTAYRAADPVGYTQAHQAVDEIDALYADYLRRAQASDATPHDVPLRAAPGLVANALTAAYGACGALVGAVAAALIYTRIAAANTLLLGGLMLLGLLLGIGLGSAFAAALVRQYLGGGMGRSEFLLALALAFVVGVGLYTFVGVRLSALAFLGGLPLLVIVGGGALLGLLLNRRAHLAPAHDE